MQVIKPSFESTIHNVCADLVQQELSGLKRFTIGAVVCAPVYALTARVIACAAHVFWIMREGVQFVPRMIGITVALAMNDKASLSRPYIQKAAETYALYFKAIASQFAVGSLACVIPEFSHYVLELHKPLFTLQLDTFVRSLPDLPYVQKDIRKSYKYVDSIAHLYQRLGLTDDEWRQSVAFAVQNTYRDNPSAGPSYLTTDSKLFQETFKRTLLFHAASMLNRKQQQGKLTVDVVDGLHLDIWRHMKPYLDIATQTKLIDLLRENTVDYQVNPHFINLCKIYTRNPDSVAVLSCLAEKMKESRDKLISDKKFTQEEVQDGYGFPASSAMLLDGLVRLLDVATLSRANPPAITFALSGQNVTFEKEHAFFDFKPRLVAIKQELAKLTKEERACLYELCCDKPDPDHPLKPTAATTEVFQLLRNAKWDFFDYKMSNVGLDEASAVDWESAFTF